VIGQKDDGNIQSLRPSDFAPAFGRAVAATRRLFYGTAKAVPFASSDRFELIHYPLSTLVDIAPL
jgi:hypothetical protein